MPPCSILRATFPENKEVFNFSHHQPARLAKPGPTSKTGGLSFQLKISNSWVRLPIVVTY